MISDLLEGNWGKLELQKVFSVVCPCCKMREVLFQIKLLVFRQSYLVTQITKAYPSVKLDVSVDNILGSRQTKMDGKKAQSKAQTELLFQQKLLRFINAR